MPMQPTTQAASPYERDLRSIRRHRRNLLSGSAAERKRKALEFLVAAGIATPTGRLTVKYR